MKATSQYTVWLYDIACSIHVTGSRNLLTDLKPEQCKVNGIGPNPVYSTHIGKAVLAVLLVENLEKFQFHKFYIFLV
jgi:hypothetical protein